MPIASWPGYEYLHLAQEKGLDTPQGLALKTPGFPDPQDIVKAYEQGRSPIAKLTTVEAVDLCSRVPSCCPAVVLILDESRGGDKLAVRRSLGSILALRGRRVGVTPSTPGPYVLSRALAVHGMGLRDVRIVAMPLAYMGRRLSSREIFDVLVVDPASYRTHVDALARLPRVLQQAHGPGPARSPGGGADGSARRGERRGVPADGEGMAAATPMVCLARRSPRRPD